VGDALLAVTDAPAIVVQLLQGTRVGSMANLTMAGSSPSMGVWALSLSACGGLLAAVSSDGRLEVRRQECTAWRQLIPRGLLQLRDAPPRPDATAAGAESSARAMHVLLGEAAEAAPPPAPDGQAPTPPHLALRVVAFNPNPAHRRWVACAGPSGLLACVRMPTPDELALRTSSGKPRRNPPKGMASKADSAPCTKGGAGSAEVPPAIDSKLWSGAAAAGWSLKQGHNYSYTYISPDGRRFSNRRAAQAAAGSLLESGELPELGEKGEAPRERGAEDTEGGLEARLGLGDRVSLSGASYSAMDEACGVPAPDPD